MKFLFLLEPEKKRKGEEVELEDVKSLIYRIEDLIDMKDVDQKSKKIGAFFEAKICPFLVEQRSAFHLQTPVGYF